MGWTHWKVSLHHFAEGKYITCSSHPNGGAVDALFWLCALPQGTWRPCGATWDLCIRWRGQLTAGYWSAAAATALWRFGTSRLGSSTLTYQVTPMRWGEHKHYFQMLPIVEKVILSNSVAHTGIRSGLESRWTTSGQWRERQMSQNVRCRDLQQFPVHIFWLWNFFSADGEDSRPVEPQL